MNRIGLIAVDSNYPNLALMKISSYHKRLGDNVEWYDPFSEYDKVYMSKIFSFTEDYDYYIKSKEIEKGGTGYSIEKSLPSYIDSIQPDYSLYPSIDNKTAYGFLTRGCPNKCKWCVVPQKEGNIKPYMDIQDIAIQGRNNIILMDNNILASDFGLEQLQKIAKMKLKIDFNQGLDARLVTTDIAELLSCIKWNKRIRFGCDTPKQIQEVEKAIKMLDKYGYKGEYFLYCILLEFEESIERVCRWRNISKRIIVHAQPYRDINSSRQNIPQWQKDLAHWANRKELYRSCNFKDFSPRKGFKCEEYFF